jgi:hypothetical protein
MFVNNNMIKSGAVIKSKALFGSYPSDYNPHGRPGNFDTMRPSTLPNQFDTGFETTKTIAPFQQSFEVERAVPGSVFRTSKSNKFYRAKDAMIKKIQQTNAPRVVEIVYDDIFGNKANELVDYIGNKLKQFAPGVVGPAGPMGPQGPMGLTGVKGDQGQMGLSGMQGEPGLQGLTGMQGEPGLQGLAGMPGEPGVQGPKGEIGQQGIVGNGPSAEQVQFIIQQQLENLPSYITNIVESQLVGLPTYVQAEIIGNLTELPRLIETNSVGLKDVVPLISQMIEDAKPADNDIFTNHGALVTIPQNTETGNMNVPQPSRVFEKPSFDDDLKDDNIFAGVNDIEELQKMKKAIQRKNVMTENDLILVDQIEERIQEIRLVQTLKKATSSTAPPVPPMMDKRPRFESPVSSKRPKIKREPISQAEQEKITLQRQIEELETKIRVLSKKKQTNKIKNQIFQLEGALIRLKAK